MRSIESVVFASLLGMAPTNADVAHLDLPASVDRAHVAAKLSEVAAHRANGDDTAARQAADEVLAGIALSNQAAQPATTPAQDFASWWTTQTATEET